MHLAPVSLPKPHKRIFIFTDKKTKGNELDNKVIHNDKKVKWNSQKQHDSVTIEKKMENTQRKIQGLPFLLTRKAENCRQYVLRYTSKENIPSGYSGEFSC